MLVLAMGVLSNCSMEESQSNHTTADDGRSKAITELRAVDVRISSTVDEIAAFSQEVGMKLPNEISDAINEKADTDIAVAKASYDANLANYEATGAGVAAGMRDQNAMRETKMLALDRMIKLKNSSLPFLGRLEKWQEREAVAKAGRTDIAITDRLVEASAELAGAQKLLGVYKKMEPSYSSKVRPLQSRLEAYQRRLSDDITTYNRLAEVAGLARVSVRP